MRYWAACRQVGIHRRTVCIGLIGFLHWLWFAVDAFQGRAIGFHADVAVTGQQLAGDVPGNVHDHLLARAPEVDDLCDPPVVVVGLSNASKHALVAGRPSALSKGPARKSPDE